MLTLNARQPQADWFLRITDHFQQTPELGVSRRGRRILDKLVAQKQASPEAVQAMLNLVDPFPDSALEAVGWPDSSGCPSVAFVDREEITVSAPSGTTTAWNFHVTFSPYITDTAALGTLFTWGPTGTISGGGSIAGKKNVWNVYKWKDNDAIPNPLTVAPDVSSTVGSSIPAACMARICATGVEAVNTSTPLYRGGYQYAYRTKSRAKPATYTEGVAAGAATSNAFRLSTVYTAPPVSPDQIVNMANTFTGSAENGCVVINTPQSFSENEYEMYCPRYDLMVGNSASPCMRINADGIASYWNNAGIFVTGLAPQATFTLKFRTFMEASPLDVVSVTAALSKPGVAHSPVVEEILAGILRDMPAGFDYRENPFGEWFMKILDTVANVAPVIGNVLSPVFPPAALIGNGVGALANGISGTVNHVRERKRKKQEAKLAKKIK